MHALIVLALLRFDPYPDLPPLALSDSLPPHKFCKEQEFTAYKQARYLAIQLAHFNEPRNQAALDLMDAMEETRLELRCREKIWEHASYCSAPGSSVKARREHLATLIELAGWEAVLTGMLPSVVDLLPIR